jgi:hypothetical protein
VVTAMRSLGQATLITTEEVFDEFLAHYSGHGPTLRTLAVGGFLHIPPKRYIPRPARSEPTVGRMSRQGTWPTRSLGPAGFVVLNRLAPIQPASWRSADVS